VSELDFLLGNSEEQKVSVEVQTDNKDKSVDRSERGKEVEREDGKASKNGEEKERRSDNVTEIMRKFVTKDPKIGVWSYPSFLLLQYLYSTIPGFRMSRVAKEALEKGLKDMYPDLFRKAEEVYRSTIDRG